MHATPLPPLVSFHRIGRGALGMVLLAGFMLAAARAADVLPRRTWTVEGVEREALVYAPAAAKTLAAPVVFVFHGHGGAAQNMTRIVGLHTLWPEAIVIYPQGLNTPGRLTDPEGKKPGWQQAAGNQGDRDLEFFDAMLATLRREYRVDDRRIYSTGHSNGAGFTYLLWAMRGDTFAAVAPCAAAAASARGKLKPKPVMHIAGEKDALVKFEWQQQTIAALRKLNGCGEGRPWADQCTIYPSPGGTPVVAMIYPGTHAFPKHAPPLIVKFFKEYAKP